MTPAQGGDSDSVYYGPNWQDTRKQVIESDGGVCAICQSGECLHVHHIKPIRSFEEVGVANREDNLVTLCERCHHRVEVIQDGEKRRGIESFTAELESEGITVSKSLIRQVTHKSLKTNPEGADVCPHDGCFYPVDRRHGQCVSCGGLLRDNTPTDESGGEYASYAYVITCEDCDLYKVYRNDHPEPPYTQDEWFPKVRAEASRDNHRDSEFRDYKSGKRHRPSIELVNDLPCDCAHAAKSKEQAINHLRLEHNASPIGARKALNHDGEEVEDII